MLEVDRQRRESGEALFDRCLAQACGSQHAAVMNAQQQTLRRSRLVADLVSEGRRWPRPRPWTPGLRPTEVVSILDSPPPPPPPRVPLLSSISAPELTRPLPHIAAQLQQDTVASQQAYLEWVTMLQINRQRHYWEQMWAQQLTLLSRISHVTGHNPTA